MAELPTQMELMWPVLKALKKLGGSGSIAEIDAQVIDDQGFTEDEQSILHGDGPRTELQYRLAWSRTYLKNPGFIENPGRGLWILTDLGAAVDEARVRRDVSAWKRSGQPSNTPMRPSESSPFEKAAFESINTTSTTGDWPIGEENDWKNELLGHLQRLSGIEFEHLAMRLLREEGFVNTRVTQASKDGGIDGVRTYRISLISFRIFFQCKRYVGSVRAAEIRDFRGAMEGRGDKGLLITTGSFTADAQKEASREGATPIELIDGDRFCDLLRERELGVKTEHQTREIVRIDPGFFESTFPTD